MSLSYRELFNQVEEAVFQLQAKNSFEVIRHLRRNNRDTNFDKKEIDKMIFKVATQYKQG